MFLKENLSEEELEEKVEQAGEKIKEIKVERVDLESKLDNRNQLLKQLAEDLGVNLNQENSEGQEFSRRLQNFSRQEHREFNSRVFSYLSSKNDQKTSLEKDLERKENQLEGANYKKEEACKFYLNHFREIFDTKNYSSKIFPPAEEELHKLREDHLKIKAEYESEFKRVVREFLQDEENKFQDCHLGQLSKALLPDIFKTSEVVEEEMIEEIHKYLREINEKNKDITKRKLAILLDLFHRVNDLYEEYLNTIAELKKFFSGKDKQITGGHQVKLEHLDSKNYPQGWIDQFLREINLQKINNTQFFETLANTVQMEELMIKAYHECGGGVSDPKPENLLNPKSYFDLSFHMEKHGTTNKGSTGQVYAAIALLCIARISLVEKDSKKQRRKGIRFMPVDEAEGLGGNYDMLYKIAKEEDYQLISMSINPAGEIHEGEQYLHILNENPFPEEEVNHAAFGYFSNEEGLIQNLSSFMKTKHD